MADSCAVTIPMERVQRIQIYINSSWRTLAAIKKATGADYVLNGTLYNMTTGAVNCHLKADGRVIARPPYTVLGYAWNEGADIGLDKLPTYARNYIACTPLIVDGRPLPKLTYDPGQGGKRGRSAIGIKDGRLAPHTTAGSAETCSFGPRLVLYCTRDGGSMARTPEQLRDELVRYGWDSAVMLDGGGSAQCDFNGQRINSTRRVQHLILVYLKKGEALEPEAKKPMVTINAYSKGKDGAKQLSPHFKVREFACTDGTDTVFVAPKLVEILEKIRTHFGKPVVINSGYRTAAKNKAVNGASYSQHLYGTAADISIQGVTPQAVAAYARKLMPNYGGVGIYDNAKSGHFTHVDVREQKADWKE